VSPLERSVPAFIRATLDEQSREGLLSNPSAVTFIHNVEKIVQQKLAEYQDSLPQVRIYT